MEAPPRIPMLTSVPSLFALFDDGIHRAGDTDDTYFQKRYKIIGASRALRTHIFTLYSPAVTINDSYRRYAYKMRACEDVSSVLTDLPSPLEVSIAWGNSRASQRVLMWPTGYQLYYPPADLWIPVLDISVHQDYPGQYLFHYEYDDTARCKSRQQRQRQLRSRMMGVHSDSTEWATFPTATSVARRPPTPIPSMLDLAVLDTDESPSPSAPAAPQPAPAIPKFVAEALKRDAIGKGESCAITMTPFAECRALTLTSCFHLFDQGALATWMEKSCACPVCKQEIVSQVAV